MGRQIGSLWQNPDFLKFWGGETISVFGSQITALALPLVAADTLRAAPGQMGLLGFAQSIPWLLFGLVAGVWVDRRRRRPLLVAANLLRAGLLALIPLAALSGTLQLVHLYVVGFLAGFCTVFFDVAYVAFLPSLVARNQLVEGNSKLQTSVSASEAIGPGLAGVLVQAISAPLAIALDAISFGISALSLIWIRNPEPAPEVFPQHPSLLREAVAGLRLVLGHRLLRGFVGCSTTGNIAIDAHLAVYVLYLTRELRVGAGMLGLLFALAGVGGLLGAVLSDRLVQLMGMGRATVLSQLFHGICMTALPLASLFGALMLPLMGLAHFLWGLTAVTYVIPALSLRQGITPANLQGRVTASQRVLTFGVSPLGFLIGGFMGEWLGLWPTLVITGIGLLLSNLWLSLSPLPGIREIDSVPPELALAGA